MDFIKRMLKRASESEIMSREKYSYEAMALGTIKSMVSIWADDTHRGEPLKGHQRVRWVKDVYARIQELDKIFKEAEND